MDFNPEGFHSHPSTLLSSTRKSSEGLWSRIIQSLILHGRLGLFSIVLVVVILFHQFDRLLCLLSFEIICVNSLHSASDMMLWRQKIPQILIRSNQSKLNSVLIFSRLLLFDGIQSAYKLPSKFELILFLQIRAEKYLILEQKSLNRFKHSPQESRNESSRSNNFC